MRWLYAAICDASISYEASVELQSRRHTLVVGGTGMLRGLCLYLADQGHDVSVIARRRGPLEALASASRRAVGAVHPLALNYKDVEKVKRSLEIAQQTLGPISLAVFWIHSDSPGTVPVILSELGREGICRVLHVRGSAAANPLRIAAEQPWIGNANIRYEPVILGYCNDDLESRWLSHAEIVRGLIAAIESPNESHVVGTVAPWSGRPQSS